MGKAFHRKQISLGRFSKTRGVGIGYTQVMPPAPRELTAEDIAAREAERQKQVALEEGRRLREWNIIVITSVTNRALDLWKDATDYTDQRLMNFAGWTTDHVCHLPIDAGLARVYSRQFAEYIRLVGRPLTLEQMDGIVATDFGQRHAIPLTQVVEEASELIRPAVEKYCDPRGIEIDLLIQSLQKRATRANSNKDIGSAVAFVSEKIAEMFEAAMNCCVKEGQ